MKSQRDLPLAQPGLGDSGKDGSAVEPSVNPRRADPVRLVSEHFDFIWRLVRRLGFSPADADDVTQQVFMTATQKVNDIAPGSERTFLYGVALRTASNFKRKAHRHREEAAPEAEDLQGTTVPPDEAAALSRACALLDQILRTLSPELRRVFILASIEQLELSEIAELEQIPQGTVASRLRRARAAVAERLQEHKSALRND